MNKHVCSNYHIIKQKTSKPCNVFHKVSDQRPSTYQKNNRKLSQIDMLIFLRLHRHQEIKRI